VILASAYAAPLLLAQNTPASGGGASWIQIVFSGGPIGIAIMLVLIGLSITALALAVEHWLTIRADVLMPPGLADQIQQRLAKGDLAGARQVCSNQPSFLGFVVGSALAEAEGGWSAVEKALEDSAAEQAARLYRKIEYLSVIGNIAPMVGLLGTVVGMILAFQEVASTQGAPRAAQLASGIYQALVTTVAGLVIAIPALGVFAIYRNRVDQLVAETAYAAQHALLPVKRALMRRTTSVTPPPVVPQPPRGS
jgi:biopolymer transport protein ExbB